MAGVVSGFEINVASTAAGRLARSPIATTPATSPCPSGTNTPKNMPIASPLEMELRFTCHSHGRSSSGPIQRKLLWLRKAAGSGSQRRKKRRAMVCYPRLGFRMITDASVASAAIGANGPRRARGRSA